MEETPRPLHERWELPLVAVLLTVHFGLAVTSSLEKSPTFDEVAHIAAGYLYWQAGDYRFNPESGNLIQRWTALPLLLQDLQVPPPGSPERRGGNVWTVGRQFFYGLGNDTETMLFAARAMIALLGVGLGALVYFESRCLFGRPGAILSLVLYATSPTILAHSRLATAGLGAALFFLLAACTLSRLLERLTPRRLLAAVLAVGGLVLTKMSWLLVVPLAVVLLLVRWTDASPWIVRWPRRRDFAATSPAARLAVAATTGLVIAVGVVALVWAVYGFKYEAAGSGDAGGLFLHTWESRLEGSGPATPFLRLAAEERLLPEAFLWGMAYTLRTTRGRDAFLRGEYRRTGWWHFFPYAFLVKTPLPLLGLLALAALGAVARRRRSWGAALRRTAPLWALFGIYGLAAVTSPLNLGHRHLLPLYPVLIILSGGAAVWLRGRRRMPAIAVIALVVLFVGESWAIRPHYLSYFNTLAGGPERAYHRLVDSSLDWGQDLPALADEIARYRANEPATPIHVAYLGTADPRYYGIDASFLHSYFQVAVPTPPLPLTGGLYCVSASLVQTLYTGRPGHWTAAYEEEYQGVRRRMLDFWGRAGTRPLPAPDPLLLALFESYNQLRSIRLFHRLQDLEPEARAGYSILIFRLSDEDVRQAIEGPPPEIAPFSGLERAPESTPLPGEVPPHGK